MLDLLFDDKAFQIRHMHRELFDPCVIAGFHVVPICYKLMPLLFAIVYKIQIEGKEDLEECSSVMLIVRSAGRTHV